MFSIVYSESNTQTDIQKHLVRATETHGLKPILKEAIPLKVGEGGDGARRMGKGITRGRNERIGFGRS